MLLPAECNMYSRPSNFVWSKQILLPFIKKIGGLQKKVFNLAA